MRAPARRIAVPLLAAAFAAPAAAPAAAEPPTGGTAAPQPATAIVAQPHVFVGKFARFTGGFHARDAGKTVTIERFDASAAAWAAVTTAQVQADGSYVALWRADVTGRHRTRATLAGAAAQNADGGASAFAAAAAGEEASMTVYRRAVASWYGPGFYGRKTACGQRMTQRLLGVAHKRLPCGSEVAITYGGRSITVPVVDRGPFVRGRRWDLTAAAARALRFTFTDRIGAVRIG
jgi:rare lipoprotein A (peptidoglycan hydrolase)